MDFAAKEQEANSRILAAARFLGEHHHIAVPGELAVVSGSQQERRVLRLLAVATFLEILALDAVQSGLGAKLAQYGFTSLADLRKASEDDLLAVEGVGKKTAETLKNALISEPVKVEPFAESTDEDDLLVGDTPTVEEMLDELSE